MPVTILRGDHATRQARHLAGNRTMRAPHHTASLPAIRGRLYFDAHGRLTYKPGEIGLAGCNGVLLLDDLPEWRMVTIAEIGSVLRDGLSLHTRQDGEDRWLRVPVQFEVIATVRGLLPDTPEGTLRRYEERMERFRKLLEVSR